MDEEERELVWQQLPLRQRGLKIAAVFACLPQLHPRDDGEWMSVPCLPWLFRMDGDCLWWRRGGGGPSARLRRLGPAQVAAFLREQAETDSN